MENELSATRFKWNIIGLSETRMKGEHLVQLNSGHVLYTKGGKNQLEELDFWSIRTSKTEWWSIEEIATEWHHLQSRSTPSTVYKLLKSTHPHQPMKMT